jgi:hypothetical protein
MQLEPARHYRAPYWRRSLPNPIGVGVPLGAPEGSRGKQREAEGSRGKQREAEGSRGKQRKDSIQIN